MASKAETAGDGFDVDDETTFLFTSESVGEGHPGTVLFCMSLAWLWAWLL